MENNIRNVNIWESKLSAYCIPINTYEELINFIKEKDTMDLTTHDTQYPNNEPKTYFDNIATKQNVSITYTDKDHPITVISITEGDYNILINPNFLNEHKEKLKKDLTEITIEKIKSKPRLLRIPDFIIDDDLINILTTSPELVETTILLLDLTGTILTQEQINKIRQAHLEVKAKNEKISTKYLIEYNTIKDLKSEKKLNLYDTLSNNEIENFIYINDSAIITINQKYNSIKDERTYFNNLKNIFEILKKHNKTYNIKITVENRQLLKQYNLLNYPNIDLIIDNDLHDYKKEEYLKEEEQLDKLILPIKNSNLSPYEKYLAVYNIVKQFKPYKESKEDLNESRYLRYILNNEYLVCVGFSKLLTTLLEKVDIPAIEISTSVDTSEYNDETKENVETNLIGHARNIIKIDDDKYNIHGIFIADSTWDNDMDIDLYNNSAMTFDKKKESKRLETLHKEDLLLDFHNFDEFLEKINYYLKRKINSSHRKEHISKIIDSYQNTYNDITNIIIKLDYQKFLYFNEKYKTLIEDTVKQIQNNNEPLSTLENIYSDFLTEYATYIIPLTNKKIDKQTLLSAATSIKKELHSYSEQELNEWLNKTDKIYDVMEEKAFPYIYNPNETRQNYLETNTSSKSK